MKTEGLEQLYHHLTPSELARMAFNTNSPGSADLARIIAAVPRRQYLDLDAEYRAWSQSLYSAALIWTILHCRVHFCVMAASAGFSNAIHEGEVAVSKTMFDELWDWESRLLAVDCALDDFCNAHGLNPETVRGIAKTERYEPIIGSNKLIPNPEFREEIRQRLAEWLPPEEARTGSVRS